MFAMKITKCTEPNWFNQPYKTKSNKPIETKSRENLMKVPSQLELSLAQLSLSLFYLIFNQLNICLSKIFFLQNIIKENVKS